jgi:hypothetical protein
MILPSKHISQEKALLSVGADLLNRLESPKTVSSIWEGVRRSPSIVDDGAQHLSYDWFILALDLLFIFDAIDIHEGLLRRRA